MSSIDQIKVAQDNDGSSTSLSYSSEIRKVLSIFAILSQQITKLGVLRVISFLLSFYLDFVNGCDTN